MHFHCVDPPIDFPTHAVFSPCLSRTATCAERFHADNVFVVKRVQRFVPGLFPNELDYFLRYFFCAHFFSFHLDRPAFVPRLRDYGTPGNSLLKNFSKRSSTLFQPSL